MTRRYIKKQGISKNGKRIGRPPKRRFVRRKYKRFASEFERVVSEQLLETGVPFEYETITVEYPKVHTYKPDFILPGGIIIETKGRFTAQDRAKHLAVRNSHPDLDVRFIFMQDNRLYKKAKSKYSDWCRLRGFKYAFKIVPDEWIQEVYNKLGRTFPPPKSRNVGFADKMVT